MVGAGADEDAGETEHGRFFGEGAAVGEDAAGENIHSTHPNFRLFRRGAKSPIRKLIIIPTIYRSFPTNFRSGDVAPMARFPSATIEDIDWNPRRQLDQSQREFYTKLY